MTQVNYYEIAEHIKPAAEQLPDAASVRDLAHASYDLRPQDAVTVWQTEDVEEQARIWSEWTTSLASLAEKQRPVVRHSLDLATQLGIRTLQALRSYSDAQLVGMTSNRGLHMSDGKFELNRKRIVILEAFGKTDNPINTKRSAQDVPPNPFF